MLAGRSSNFFGMVESKFHLWHQRNQWHDKPTWGPSTEGYVVRPTFAMRLTLVPAKHPLLVGEAADEFLWVRLSFHDGRTFAFPAPLRRKSLTDLYVKWGFVTAEWMDQDDFPLRGFPPLWKLPLQYVRSKTPFFVVGDGQGVRASVHYRAGIHTLRPTIKFLMCLGSRPVALAKPFQAGFDALFGEEFTLSADGTRAFFEAGADYFERKLLRSDSHVPSAFEQGIPIVDQKYPELEP